MLRSPLKRCLKSQPCPAGSLQRSPVCARTRGIGHAKEGHGCLRVLLGGQFMGTQRLGLVEVRLQEQALY